MTAIVTIIAPEGRTVDALPVHYPPTAEESARVQEALRLACTTRLRLATLCACLVDRETGVVKRLCYAHTQQAERAS